MNGFVLSNLSNILQVGVLLYVSYRNLRNLQQRGPWVPAVLFMFLLVTWLATGFYWLAHLLMKEEYLYGFSAMDIGEIGIFLLLSALVGASFKEPLPRDLPALAASLLFAVGNVIFWGVWAGAWARDIVAGFFLWILVYTLIRGLKKTNSLSRPVWIAFGTGSAGIFLLQIAQYLAGGTTQKVSEFGAEVLWFAGIVYVLVRIIRTLRENLPEEGLISLACAAEIWIVCTMYLSGGLYYTIADLVNTIMFLVMMLVLERKWGETV